MGNNGPVFKRDARKAGDTSLVTSVWTSAAGRHGVDPHDAHDVLFQNLPVGMYRSTPSGLLLDVNPALVRLLGYPDRKTLLQVSLNDISTSAERHQQFIGEMERAGHINDFETTVRRADGAVLAVLLSAYSQSYPDGRVCCYEGIVVDITARRRNDERLRLQAAALEAAAEGVVITGPTGSIEWVNPAFTRLTGYTAEEACGQNPRMLKSGHHDQAFYAALWETIQSGQVWHGETINRRKDGTLYTEEQTIAPVVDSAGQITHFIAIKHDITVRKHAEETRTRLLAILEATPDFVGVADPAGHAVYVNRGGRRMLGHSDDEAVASRPIRDAYSDLEWARMSTEAIPAAIRDGLWSGESVMLRSDGSPVPVLQVLLAHKNGGGEVEFLSTIARDISVRKDAEARIHRQLDFMASLRAIDVAIAESLDLRVTLDIVLDQVTSQLHVDAADVLLLDPVTDTLQRTAVRGISGLRHDVSTLSRDDDVWRAVHERRTFVVDLRGRLHQEVPPRLHATDFVTYIASPLIAKGVVRGVLEVFLKKPFVPDAEWHDHLEAFCGQTAIAIDNAALLDGLRRANANLTERVFR